MSKLKEVVGERSSDHNPTVNFIFQLALLTMMAEPMLKHKKTRRVKTAHPARFINPGENHTARIYPRQSIRIVVDCPQKSANVSEEAHWEFTLSSPYLVLTNKYENKKEQEVYEFSQVYDLTEWAKISEVYLGEVYYQLVNNTHPKAKEGPKGGSVMVFMNPEGGGRPEVLTVVNPNENFVKLEPNRIMEVVLFEDWPKGHLDDWKVEIQDLSVDKDGIFLNEVAKTWVGNNHVSGVHAGFNILSRHNPTVNGGMGEKLRNEIVELGTQSKPTREHHFWFQFDPESQRRCRTIKNGNYTVTKLTFTGTCSGITGRAIKHEMLVLLSLRGKPERVVDMETVPEGDMLAEAGKRILDKQRCILTNPGITDQLDFNSQTDSYTIEIVSPKYIWGEEPDTGRWEVEYDNDHLKDSYLTFVAIPPLNKHGVMYQRIRVKRKDLGTCEHRDQHQKILGSIKLFYPKKMNIEESVRRISMWIVKDTASSKECHTKINSRSIYSGTTNTSYTSSSGEHWKAYTGRYDRPRRSKVTIEEIPLAPLEENAKTRKLSEVKMWSDDNEFSNYSHYLRGQVISKKNETSAQFPISTAVLGTPLTIGSSATRTATSTLQTLITETEEIILFNPVHLQEIVLTPNQVLVLRLSQPEDMYMGAKDKCRGELWTVNPLEINEVKPVIEKNCISRLSSTKYRQEVRIRLNESHFPESSGNWCAGAVAIQSSCGNRIIRLRFMKGESAESVYTPPKIGRVLNNLVTHEAAGRKYEYAPEWRHDDCVLLDPETMFYVMNPEDKDWPDEWSVRLIPHPIEVRIWDKMSPGVTSLVDRCRPWYKRDMPAHLNRTLYFKPLSMSCNADITKVLNELAQITRADIFPVATLMYENNKKTYINGAVAGGIVEQTTRCRRRMYLYVKLPEYEKYKGKTLTFEPKRGENIHVRVGDEVSIRVKTIKDEKVMRWTSKSYPSFLKYHGMSIVGDEWDIFRFTVQKRGSDMIYFYNPAGEGYGIHITSVD